MIDSPDFFEDTIDGAGGVRASEQIRSEFEKRIADLSKKEQEQARSELDKVDVEKQKEIKKDPALLEAEVYARVTKEALTGSNIEASVQGRYTSTMRYMHYNIEGSGDKLKTLAGKIGDTLDGTAFANLSQQQVVSIIGKRLHALGFDKAYDEKNDMWINLEMSSDMDVMHAILLFQNFHNKKTTDNNDGIVGPKTLDLLLDDNNTFLDVPLGTQEEDRGEEENEDFGGEFDDLDVDPTEAPDVDPTEAPATAIETAETELTIEKDTIKEAYKKELIRDSVNELFAKVEQGLTEDLSGRDKDTEQADLAVAMDNIKTLVQNQDTPEAMIAVAQTSLQAFLEGVEKKKMPLEFDATGRPTAFAKEKKLLIFNSSKVLNKKERENLSGTLTGYLENKLPALADMMTETDVAKWGLDTFPTFKDLEGKLSEKRDLLDAALQKQLKVEGELADLKAQLITQTLIYDSLYTQKVNLQEKIDLKRSTSGSLENENIADELQDLEKQLQAINKNIISYAGEKGLEGIPDGGLIQATKNTIAEIEAPSGELEQVYLLVQNAKDAYDKKKEEVQAKQDLRVDTWKVANKDVISNDEIALDGTSELTDLETAIFHLEEQLSGPAGKEGEGIIADIEKTQQEIIEKFNDLSGAEYQELAATREEYINKKHTTEEAIRQKNYQKNVVHMREYEANRQLLTLEHDKLDIQWKELDNLQLVKESKLDQQLSLLLSLDDYVAVAEVTGRSIDETDIASQKEETVATIATIMSDLRGSNSILGTPYVVDYNISFQDLQNIDGSLETVSTNKKLSIVVTRTGEKMEAKIFTDNPDYPIATFDYPNNPDETTSIFSKKISIREEQGYIGQAVQKMEAKKTYMETFTQWDIVSQQLESLVFDKNLWAEQRDALTSQKADLYKQVAAETFVEGDKKVSHSYDEWQGIYNNFRNQYWDSRKLEYKNNPSDESKQEFAHAKTILNTYQDQIDALSTSIDAANAKIDALQATIDEKTAIKESLEEGDNGLKVRYATLTNDVANKYITSEKYSALDLPAVEKELTPEDYENLLPNIHDTDEID